MVADRRSRRPTSDRRETDRAGDTGPLRYGRKNVRRVRWSPVLVWIPALLVAAGATHGLAGGLRRWALRNSWYDRRRPADRKRRGRRRPSHGGLAVAIAVVVASAAAGPGSEAWWAVLAAGGLAVGSAWRAETGAGPAWLPSAGRVAAALVVPLVGVRAELTGSTGSDVALTALGVLAVSGGLARLERTREAMPTVAAAAALGLLVLAAGTDDRAPAVVAAVVLGSMGAAFVNGASPPVMRLGRIGPTVTGAALCIAAIDLEVGTAAPRSLLVPVLVLAVPAVAAVFVGWPERLARRHLPPGVALGAATAVGAVAAVLLGRGTIEPIVALAAGLAPVALLVLVAIGPAGEGVEPIGRRRWLVAGSAVVAGVCLAVPAALTLLGVRDSMLDGADAARDGLDAARAGDLDRAEQLLATAESTLASARGDLDSPVLWAGRIVPGLAQNLHGARTLAAIGEDLASTGRDVADRAGADDLRVVEGRFPIEGARQVATDLAGADDALRRAAADLEPLGSPLLLDEVEDAIDELAVEVDDSIDSIGFALDATRLLPELLGGEGPRRYFLAVVTPSELRGSGGVMGNWGILSAVDGQLDLEQNETTRVLNEATDPDTMAAVLPDELRGSYRGFLPQIFWQNITVSPDFPTTAQAISAALPTTGNAPVDGVISIDPLGLAAMLQLTGPVAIPEWPVPITAENAVEILLFEHYDVLEGETRDEFQSAVASAVTDRLTTGSLPAPAEVARVLGAAVAGGHLRLWSPDDDATALFARMGIDGALAGPDTDGTDDLMVITQNGSEAKNDWFLRRELAYDVVFDPTTGTTSAVATVTLTNLAPAEGVSSYVIGGDGISAVAAGENRTFLTIRSRLQVVAVRDGAGAELPSTPSTIAGMGATTVLLRLPPGGSATVAVELAGQLGVGDEYRLRLGQQPLAWPDQVTVTSNGGAAPTQLTLDRPRTVVHPME